MLLSSYFEVCFLLYFKINIIIKLHIFLNLLHGPKNFANKTGNRLSLNSQERSSLCITATGSSILSTFLQSAKKRQKDRVFIKYHVSNGLLYIVFFVVPSFFSSRGLGNISFLILRQEVVVISH